MSTRQLQKTLLKLAATYNTTIGDFKGGQCLLKSTSGHLIYALIATSSYPICKGAFEREIG